MPRPLPDSARAAFRLKSRDFERARRRMGLSGLVVFVLGVLLAPIAHNVGHRADHVHRASHFEFALDALREQMDARAHEHAHAEGRPHAHRRPATHEHAVPPSDESDRDERRGSDPHHGAGSLAHFAAAVLAPALFVVPPTSTRRESLVPVPLESVCERESSRGPIQPRAPPA